VGVVVWWCGGGVVGLYDHLVLLLRPLGRAGSLRSPRPPVRGGVVVVWWWWWWAGAGAGGGVLLLLLLLLPAAPPAAPSCDREVYMYTAVCEGL
jgi:hypothetical protein